MEDAHSIALAARKRLHAERSRFASGIRIRGGVQPCIQACSRRISRSCSHYPKVVARPFATCIELVSPVRYATERSSRMSRTTFNTSACLLLASLALASPAFTQELLY